jgi:hypothetical protein
MYEKYGNGRNKKRVSGTSFHGNNLMKAKPAIHPYSFDQLDGTEQNNSDPLYSFTRLTLGTPSLLSQKSDHVLENTHLNTKYKSFNPKFSAASQISLKTISTNSSSRHSNNPPQPQEDPLVSQLNSQNYKIKGLMEQLQNLKKSTKNYTPPPIDRNYDELERLKNAFEESERYYSSMKKMRKMQDKLYVTKADQAIALVKSNRGPTEAELRRAIEKYGPKMDKNFEGFQAPLAPRKVQIVKRRRRPSYSSSSSSSSDDEGLTMEEIRRKAEDMVQRKLREYGDFGPNQAQQPEDQGDVVQLPNGMTLIRSKDPNQPPVILAPDGASETETVRSNIDSEFWGPTKKYMDSMLALKMMEMMKGRPGRPPNPVRRNESDELMRQLQMLETERRDRRYSKRKSKKKKKKSKKKRKSKKRRNKNSKKFSPLPLRTTGKFEIFRFEFLREFFMIF